MITDEQMIKALKTVRQYCNEREYCNKCPYDIYCYRCSGMEFELPSNWKLPGDDENDE